MKNLIFFITFIAISLSVNAQETFEVDADYIEFIDGELYAYQKNGFYNYKVFQITLKEERLFFDFVELINNDVLKERELIDFKIENDHLLPLNENQRYGEFFFFNDKEKVALKLDKFFNVFITLNLNVRSYSIAEDLSQVKVYRINLNKKHNYYLLAINKSDSIKEHFGFLYNTDKGLFFNKNELVNNPSKYLTKVQINSLQRNWYHRNDLEENFDLKSLEQKYEIKLDSLGDGFYGNFITAFKGGKKVVFNSWLNDITPSSFKDITYLNSNNFQILIGNELKYLHVDGSISTDLFPYTVYGCGLTIYDTELRVVKDTLSLNYLPVIIPQFSTKAQDPLEKVEMLSFPNEIKKTVSKKYSSSKMSFLNGSNAQETIFENYLGLKNNYIVERITDDTVLITPFYLQMDVNSTSNVSNYELIFDHSASVSYDSLEYLTKDEVYLVTLNSLKGYLGINKSPKYKILNEFQGNYARFELRDGRKGWLKKDGTEFIDQ